MGNFIKAGKIENTHGIRGDVKVNTYFDNLEMMRDIKKYYIDNTEYNVASFRIHKERALIKFKEIDNINVAEKLKEKIIYAKKSDIKLSEGVYFVEDLIGINVIDVDSGTEYGTIYDVMITGANDVYCIKNGEKEILIPAIKECIVETDIDNKIMRIRPLEGLLSL